MMNQALSDPEDCAAAAREAVTSMNNLELSDAISRTRHMLDFCPPESFQHKQLNEHLKRLLKVEFQRAQQQIHCATQFDLAAHIQRQMIFSLKTFGPGKRPEGVVDHIRKELDEVLATPANLEEWIDIILLALDGAWRNTGATPGQIAEALAIKQTKNESRTWPDWRTQPTGKAIEHVRSES